MQDDQWGLIELQNGTWNGMVGMLVEDRADVAYSGFTLNPGRKQVSKNFDSFGPFASEKFFVQVIDMTQGYDFDFQGYVSPNPTPLPTYLNLIRPLQPLVWLGTLLTLVASSLAIYLLAKFERLSVTVAPGNWSTLKSCSWYCYGTLLGEAITRDTKSQSLPCLRVALASWILFSLIIGQSYTGNLKAYLSAPSFSKPIESVKVIIGLFKMRR